MKMRYAYGILAALLMVSCGESGEEPVKNIAFPAASEWKCEVGETVTLSFVADYDWKLTSDKIWCTFDTDAGRLQNISGHKGNASVKVLIGGESLSFGPSGVAEIAMRMEGQTQKIATISRSSKEWQIALFDADGNEIQEITSGYDNFRPFFVKSNFTFSAVSWDEDVFEFQGGGAFGHAGQEIRSGLKIVNDFHREKYAFDKSAGYTVTFSDEGGNVEFVYPVVYPGMGREDMVLGLPGNERAFGWRASAGGKHIAQAGFMDSADSTVLATSYFPFNVTCLDDDFVVLAFSGRESDPSWVHIDVDGCEVQVSFDANESDAERSVEVLAMPRGLYERVGGSTSAAYSAIHPAADAPESAFEDAYRIENKCMALSLTQGFVDTATEDGMVTPIAVRTDYPIDYETGEFLFYVPVQRIFDKDLIGKYGVKAAYEVYVPVIQYGFLQLHPMIENWTSDAFSGYNQEWKADVTFYYKDRTLAAGGDVSEYEPRDYVMGDPVQSFGIMIYGPQDGNPWDEPVYAVFSLNGEALKLVVIYPPASE